MPTGSLKAGAMFLLPLLAACVATAPVDGGVATNADAGRASPGVSFPPPPADLAGTHWVLTQVDGSRIYRVPGYEFATLVFDGSRVEGGTGCNSFRGPYRIEGRRLVAGPLATTRRGCQEPGATVERRLLQLLGSPVEHRLSADGDLLIIDQGRPALRFERVPPSPPPTS